MRRARVSLVAVSMQSADHFTTCSGRSGRGFVSSALPVAVDVCCASQRSSPLGSRRAIRIETSHATEVRVTSSLVTLGATI
jgi:hypothetical protein